MLEIIINSNSKKEIFSVVTMSELELALLYSKSVINLRLMLDDFVQFAKENYCNIYEDEHFYIR